MTIMDWKKNTSQSPLYPAGTYKVKIESFEHVVARTKTRQIRWKAKIVEPVEHAGRILVDHTALTDAALWKVANLIYACGIDTLKLSNMDINSKAFSDVCNGCVGRTTYWRNEQVLDNKGNQKNSIVEYRRDEDQTPLEEVKEDAPDWAQ
jgi:hypothetical protein